MPENPLLQKFDAAPFSKIKTEHFKPAFKKCIEEAEAEIEAITQSSEKPTFSNTIEALEYSGDQLARVSSIFFNLNSAETNDEIQQIAQEVSPWLSEFGNNILLNKELFERVKAVFDEKEKLNLSAEESMLLEKQYKGFTRNGANLSDDKKKVLREIDQKLAKLSLTYGENVLAETNNYELHLTDKNDLKGLPESDIETAEELAKKKGKSGYIFTLQHPSYLPFMKYAENRELRKKLSVAFGAKAFQGNKFDNQENVLEIVKLRHKRANLLGYKTHAHFVLEERMAKSPKKVEEFLQDLLEKAKPAAEKEFAELEKFAKELDGIDKLEKWDSAYYSEKLKHKLFDLKEEELKPYFPLEKTIDGVFGVARKLYGLHFQEIFNVDKYHEEVKTYRVSDENGNFVALFYADFHPREGKRNGAWMTVYKNQKKSPSRPPQREGADSQTPKGERPHISIVCNFSRPTAKKPSLLTFNEVTTLFHEFGHALHGMLANTTYPSLSGTSVYWDFVELPSQILENWCYEKEALNLFAKHFETEENIPMELVEKIKKSANFQEGMQTLRQLSFGMLDMAWHATDPTSISDVKNYELQAFDNTKLYPDVPQNCMSTSFSHIFQGGYSAGYYSYKWAEVLDADAFAYFKENGIFDKETATKFKENILSKGGTEDPMLLYKRFRGKEPDPKALLKRAGLLN
ncbi:MAG TPA: M3 family metallopeptidase [Flavobacteriaceae bacterium]|nr:M3 family metallopeptidase [Flavobacteriaceae bacterium]